MQIARFEILISLKLIPGTHKYHLDAPGMQTRTICAGMWRPNERFVNQLGHDEQSDTYHEEC